MQPISPYLAFKSRGWQLRVHRVDMAHGTKTSGLCMWSLCGICGVGRGEVGYEHSFCATVGRSIRCLLACLLSKMVPSRKGCWHRFQGLAREQHRCWHLELKNLRIISKVAFIELNYLKRAQLQTLPSFFSLDKTRVESMLFFLLT